MVGGRVELPRLLSPRRWTKSHIEPETETWCDQTVAARPADRPAGQRAARAAVAQSLQGEVVAEAPSTPHR